jgi:hypothetical protein
MNKQQLILIILGLASVAGLYFFGSTVAPHKKSPATAAADTFAAPAFNVEMIEQQAISRLSRERQQWITGLEQNVKRGDVKDQSVHVYHKLASFWKDTVPNPFLHFT